ncbi:EpsI family protein [Sphingomonas vulcanisoli]|uniref:EpsI family protein n=1 Tax=Sphingomonas vulcanisoli TaxID=1658060 RepID=A0ABX0TUK0_9SPHN|nr:exosortase C-terminal domain/associated protein EpsI [Sphingomonas vulcanisoli]NIJ08067.1 EpsI family protein [Sphingomonas vulcanisoli]
MPERAWRSLGGLFLAGCALALLLSILVLSRARHVPPGTVPIESLLPARFGGWAEVPTRFDVVDPTLTDSDTDTHALYDKVVTRSYRRADGSQVTLTLAYRRLQQQESKIHRPELCYFAQGYALEDKHSATVPTPVAMMPAITFQAAADDRDETVLYWIRIGDTVSTSAWRTRERLFQLSLANIVPDGILVRASVVGDGTVSPGELADRRKLLAEFLGDAVQALRPDQRWMLIGGPAAIEAAQKGV